MKKEFLRFGHRMLFKILGRALDCGWVVIHTYNPDMRCRKFRLFGRTLYSSESRGGVKRIERLAAETMHYRSFI